MHEVRVNRLGGLSLPRKSVVRLTDRPDMTLDVYRGRKTTIQPTSFGHCTCECWCSDTLLSGEIRAVPGSNEYSGFGVVCACANICNRYLYMQFEKLHTLKLFLLLSIFTVK